MLGFNESYSGGKGDVPGFARLTPGRHKSDKRFNVTGIYKVHLKCDCIKGSIVNSIHESIL